VLVQNTGLTTAYVGASSNVSASNGLQLAAGASLAITADETDAATTFYGYCSGSTTLVVLQ
jgi:hypothetical protein